MASKNSSSAAALNEKSNDDEMASPKQLQDNEKDGQKAELDLNLLKIVDVEGLLDFAKSKDFMKILNEKIQSEKLNNCYEEKPEPKFDISVPFHLQVPAGIPMGRPRQPNPVPPPIIDISDDEECRGNKAPPLIQKNLSYVPPIDLCEENIPYLLSDKPKSEFKDEPSTSRAVDGPSLHQRDRNLPRQTNSNYNNNVGRPNCDNFNQEHKVINPMPSRPPCQSVPSTSSQFTHSTLPQQVPQPAVSSSANSRRLSHNQSHNSSHVENIYDRGLALLCTACTFRAHHHEDLIRHYVENHKKHDPPCGLSTANLNVIKNTKLPEVLGRKKTNIGWLDDFNWISAYQYFETPKKCKMADCPFSTKWRKQLISHLQQHRDEILAEPTTQPTQSASICLMCGFSTKDGLEFYEHCTGHTGEYMYACGRCPKTAKNKTNLKKHFKRFHEGLTLEIKSNDKSITQGIIYGYVCSVCGFVQLHKSRVEEHIKSHTYHQAKGTAEIYKFDMCRPEEPKPVPNPPAPAEALPPNRSDYNSQSNNVTRPPAASLISASNPKTNERRRSAPVKVRGDPRTARSRQDKLTQSISESHGSNSTSEASSQRVVENLNDGSSCNDASSTLQTENRNDLRTTRNVTEQIGLPEGLNEEQIVESIELPVAENPNEKQIELPVSEVLNEEKAVDQTIEQLFENPNVEASVVQIELFENLNEDLSVEFEAVKVKDENESMVNYESREIGNSVLESSKDILPSFQTPSIDDTISRLCANLAPSTSARSINILPPASNSNIESISELDCNVQKQLADWEERRKIIICSCSEMLNSSNDFYNHRQNNHTGERRVSCYECQIKFDTIPLFIHHLWTTCAKKSARFYSCKADSRCHFITSSADQFVTHTSVNHPDLEWFSCYWCESKFATSISLTNHIKNCYRAIFLNNYFLSTIKNSLTNNTMPIEKQANNLKNQILPPLNVVYRCPDNDCPHQSLERAVFVHHFRHMHPELIEEKTKLKCKYCGNYSNGFNELVAHLEEQHKDGAKSLQERTIIHRNNLPVPEIVPALSNTERQRFATEKDINLVIMEKLKLEAESEPGVCSFVFAIEWGPQEESRVYKLISLEKMCQYICLSFLVTKSSTFPQADLQQWRLDKINFNQLEGTDPVKHTEMIKSPEAIKSLYCEAKLKQLYKCCGQECIFATDKAADFCEHLNKRFCSFQCVYCDIKLPKPRTTENLEAHITNVHGSSCYQCPHCVYRSIKEHYVLVHIHIAHKNLGEKVKVLKCRTYRPSELYESVIPPPLLSMVRPISCGTGDCNFVCWDTATFVNHHKNEHSEIQHIICYFCSVKVAPNESFAAHLKRHKVFDYHCEYCGEGDAQLNNVIVHSITMHPQWIGKVFVRPELPKALKPLPPPTAPRILETAPLHPASIASSSEVISESGNRNSSISNGNVTSNCFLTCCYQLCSYSSKSLSGLKNHVRQCRFRQDGTPIYCKPCYKSFATEQMFVEHISRSHAIPEDPQSNFLCDVCDFVAVDFHLIRTHLIEAHNLDFKETTCEVKDSCDDQNLRLFVYKPAPVKVLISKSASGGFQSSTLSPSAKKDLGDKRRASNDCEGASVEPVFSQEGEHEFSSVRKKLTELLNRPATCSNPSPNIVQSNATETAKPSRRVFGENGSASLWYISKAPIYLLPKERFRCPFKHCSHTSMVYSHLEAHIFVAHEDPMEIPCRYCDIIFNDMSDFNLHLKLHGGRLFKCHYCLYFHYYDNVVKGHCMTNHAGLQPKFRVIREESETICEPANSLNLIEESGNLACDCCNIYRCFSETSLRKHIIKCLSLENYTCNVCNNEFLSETDIETHFQNFHVEMTPTFTVGVKPNVEKCLDTMLIDQVAKSKRQPPSLLVPMGPYQRTQGTSGAIVTSTMADSSTVNVTTNSSSFPISSRETMVAESVTEVISSTSSSKDKQKKRSSISKTPKTSSSADNVPPTVTSSVIANDDDDDVVEFNLHCPMCPMSLSKISKFKAHLRHNHRVEGYKCSSCPDVHFSSKDLAVKHQKAQHPDSDETLLEDSETEEFINWVIKLLKVIGAETNNVPRPIALVCKRDKCMEKFTNLYLFKSHFIEHLRKPKMQLASFENVSKNKALNKATATNETADPYFGQCMCPYCSYVSSKWHVVEHVYIHYETKFFACSYCPMECRNKLEVRKHISVKHPNDRVDVFVKPVPENLVVRQRTANTKRPVIIVTQMEPTSSSDKEDYLCNKCAFGTSSLNNIRYHCQNEHELASVIEFGKGYSGEISITSNKRKAAAASNSEIASTDTDDGGNNDDSSSEFPCKECGEVLEDMASWLIHFSANHSEESNGVKQPAKKKRKVNETAQDSQEDNDKDEDHEKLKGNSTTSSKPSAKYSVALKCGHCKFVAVVVQHLKAHWKRKHPKTKLAYTSIKNIATYQCSSCLFKTPNVREGRKHIRDRHCLKFTCDKCAKMFPTLVATKLHCIHKHPGEKQEISRKDINMHQYQILVDAMMGASSDKQGFRKEADKDKGAGKDDEEEEDDVGADNVRVELNKQNIERETNGDRVRRASCSTAAVVEQRFEPLRKERSKRRRIDNMSLDVPEFSFYRNRSSSKTYHKDQLMVNTNLKGYQNAKISYTHLCDIFNINVRVSVSDVKHDSRYSKHFV